jgi:hypothetical protein
LKPSDIRETENTAFFGLIKLFGITCIIAFSFMAQP